MLFPPEGRPVKGVQIEAEQPEADDHVPLDWHEMELPEPE